MRSTIKFTCTAIACIATSNFASALTLSMHPRRPTGSSARPTTSSSDRRSALARSALETLESDLGNTRQKIERTAERLHQTHLGWQTKEEIREAWPTGNFKRVPELDTVHKDGKRMGPVPSTARSSASTARSSSISSNSRNGNQNRDVCDMTHKNWQTKDQRLLNRCHSSMGLTSTSRSNSVDSTRSATSDVLNAAKLCSTNFAQKTHINRDDGRGLLPKIERLSPAGASSPKANMNRGRRLNERISPDVCQMTHINRGDGLRPKGEYIQRSVLGSAGKSAFSPFPGKQ